ncbi:Dipeptidase [Mobiluncus curtisii]|uniref:Dipeptidase n=1 Tax=Mobiluncus curtisii TaxID=2051 RepID=A0A2X3BQS8_9ACTO|nr:C69 family dipeptidase [Mobiluncus curtisii]SQC01656.1 Dipeptidase [Mobiluncus curtisii]
MTATETLTSNERVLGADPLVELRESQGVEGQDGYVPEQPGGIGEEDMVVLVLPYIKTAREGVLRLGELLQKYGTYEMNGIGFADNDDVWWLRDSRGASLAGAASARGMLCGYREPVQPR